MFFILSGEEKDIQEIVEIPKREIKFTASP